MKKGKCSIIIFNIFLFFSCGFFAKTVYASNFEDIKKTYSAIITLEAGFTQKIFISSLKKEREFEGDFFYKRGKGFLWRYSKPKGRYFLFDGNFIWQGEEEKPFVYKRKINRDKTVGTFFDLLDDIAKIDELFNIKERKRSGDMDVLELVPKKDGQVLSAKIWVDRLNMVKKIEIYEFTGNINTLSFTHTKINDPINDAKFIYRQEKGKEIIESH
ncbi:MAG TPA: outer membrane lipoprotein carrier protein LolA [Syntrophorhabdaceae bacterium]|nr:outer membrane lipoprotein carrier protein LolA [Syntrophorhabdaceae bacterium]HPU30049.1 outer membrane lipoprotein carrier protein LolA [Syntrophorhabdaceae bacterium]